MRLPGLRGLTPIGVSFCAVVSLLTSTTSVANAPDAEVALDRRGALSGRDSGEHPARTSAAGNNAIGPAEACMGTRAPGAGVRGQLWAGLTSPPTHIHSR